MDFLCYREHSAILLTFIKLQFVIMIKIFVMSIYEWPLQTCFTVYSLVCRALRFYCRETTQETVSLLEDNVRDVETERDELRSKIQSMTAMAEEKDQVNQFEILEIVRF